MPGDARGLRVRRRTVKADAGQSRYLRGLDCQKPRVPPVGSTTMLIRPMSATGMESTMTLAPSCLAFWVEELTSATSTYGIHADGMPLSAVIIPPPVPSPTPIMV